jgi:hypothetical protein
MYTQRHGADQETTEPGKHPTQLSQALSKCQGHFQCVQVYVCYGRQPWLSSVAPHLLLFKAESLSQVWNSASRLSWLTPQGSTHLIEAFLMWTLGWNLGSHVCTASTSLELSYQPRKAVCASGFAHCGRPAQASLPFAPLVSWLNGWRSGCS